MTHTTADALFRGDKSTSINKIEERNLKQIIRHATPRLEFLNLYDLEPLETQRGVKDTWVQDRLTALNGLDQVAFGALEIARTPDGRNLIWNGCGSYNLAEHVGWTENIPCLVFDLSEQDAAFYFNYTQKEGRRNLSPEVLMVNAWKSGDKNAVDLANVMRQLDMYIQGDTNYPVPQPKSPHAIEVRYRTINEAYRNIAKWLDPSDRTDVMRQARDLIVSSFPGEKMLQQDLYWAVYYILAAIPATRKGANYRKFQTYLSAAGANNTQAQFTKVWKIDNAGTTGNSGKAKSLATELLKNWKQGKNAPRDVTYDQLSPNLTKMLFDKIKQEQKAGAVNDE